MLRPFHHKEGSSAKILNTSCLLGSEGHGRVVAKVHLIAGVTVSVRIFGIAALIEKFFTDMFLICLLFVRFVAIDCIVSRFGHL